jgi:hypothetical protein
LRHNQVIVDSGVILLKYWLEVSPEGQTRRLEARIDDGRKTWKLSDMDLKSYSHCHSRARDEMFLATDTSWAPWYVVHSDNKRRARLNALTNILSKIRYEEPPRSKAADTAASRQLQGSRLPLPGHPRGLLKARRGPMTVHGSQRHSIVVDNRRRSIRAWQDRFRDRGLTVLLVLDRCLVFLVAPLAAKGPLLARRWPPSWPASGSGRNGRRLQRAYSAAAATS